MARDIYGNPILRYGQASPIIPSTVRLTQSPAANPYDPQATYQGDLEAELGVLPRVQRPMVSPVLGRPSVPREGAIMRGAMTPAQRSAMATKALAETARERAIRQSAMGAAQQQQQQRPKGFFDSLPSPMSPAGQALGAFGSTALQLSGYQDRPITLGAGLGAAVQAAQEAYTAAEEKKAATELAKQQRDIEAAVRDQNFYIKMLELQAAQGKAKTGEKTELIKMEQSHRKEHSDMSKAFSEGNKYYQDVLNYSAPEQSAAADLALVFSFMKMLDPTSVVREGEQAQVVNLAAIPDKIRVLLNNVGISEGVTAGELKGKMVLPPVVRGQIRAAADQKYAIIYGDQKRIDDQFIRHGVAGGFRKDYFNPLAIADGTRKKPYVFNSIEEANASGVKSGSIALINGVLKVME